MILIGWKELDTLISGADIVLEVVEARNPLATRCKSVEKIVQRKGKDLILVLNKCDLIPKSICKAWVDFFSSEAVTAVCFSNKIRYSVKNLKRIIIKAARSTPTTLVVVGYPKVGKSSLINALKGKNSAQTSPYPGVPGYTRVSQRYKIAPGVYLIDTPGVVPIVLDDNIELEIRSRPIERVDNPIPLAIKLVELIMKYNKYAFAETYGIDSDNPMHILTHIAVSRGWYIGKDREPNIIEAARAIIRDYLKGKIRFFVPPPTTGFSP